MVSSPPSPPPQRACLRRRGARPRLRGPAEGCGVGRAPAGGEPPGSPDRGVPNLQEDVGQHRHGQQRNQRGKDHVEGAPPSAAGGDLVGDAPEDGGEGDHDDCGGAQRGHDVGARLRHGVRHELPRELVPIQPEQRRRVHNGFRAHDVHTDQDTVAKCQEATEEILKLLLVHGLHKIQSIALILVRLHVGEGLPDERLRLLVQEREGEHAVDVVDKANDEPLDYEGHW
mmetsp:Transcript_2064/g.5481  ORF Transcript_2064/g.5481 Transcript_2064/m.5481 type:complete len:228 (+) Transcript_2064:215-898(+)